jgi:peptide/nickel transport system permease protein
VGFTIILLFVLMAVFAPLIAPYNPNAELYTLNQPPSHAHLLGTNALGQDLFSQIVYGSRISMEVAFASGALATIISLAVGITAGYLRGTVDSVLSWFTNLFLVVPSLPLVIVISSYMKFKGEWPIIAVIALTSWAWNARSLRAQTLSMRERDYVLHARLVGQPWWSVVVGEILPNMASLVLAGLLFAMINGLLTEAGLDFLGLGNVDVVSWGTMLYWAQNNEALINGIWWWFVPPGIAIALFGGALALLNFSLDEITNPRLRKRKVKVRAK